MNKILKNLVIISVILIVVGSVLAIIGFGLGGGKSIQLGPDGSYSSETIDLNQIDVEWIDLGWMDVERIDAERIELVEVDIERIDTNDSNDSTYLSGYS